ncbi:hypothetical protein ABW19_dt0207167 [Dactylella cylindrospora]|nr:hypothetical protein ABW19_dt0207167 [Dactylella cylindrospora]
MTKNPLLPKYEDIAYPEKNTTLASGSYTEGKRINVLIVGETQQGKSTLVQNINTYAGQSDINIEIGSGNRSCTRTTTKYDLDITLRSFHLEDHDGKMLPVAKSTYTDLCALGDEDAKVVPENEDGPLETMRFSFLDTPGLDDSEGEDMELMAGILGKVAQLDYINAIIYVRSCGKHFGQSFKVFFDYLQRSMPTIAHGLIVVHSGYTVLQQDVYIREGKDWAEIRREGFKAATNLDLAHFFMDNEPDIFSPLAVMISMNETRALLSHIKEQPEQPVTSFRLLKTPRMQEVDVYIRNTISELRRLLRKELKEIREGIAAVERQDMEDAMSIGRINRKLDSIRDDLRRYESGPDVALGSITIQEDYRFIENLLMKGQWNLEGKTASFVADCPISYTTKSVNGSSRWVRETITGNSWSGFIASGIFRGISGSATFYARSPTKYRDEIRSLKEQKGSFEDKLSLLRTRKLTSSIPHEDAQEFAELLELCDNVDVKVKRDTIDMAIYPMLRRIYLTKEPILSRGEMTDFLKVYDERIAEFFEQSRA